MHFAPSAILAIAAITATPACTTAPVSQGSLSSYENLTETKGLIAKRRGFADAALLAQQDAVFIRPVALSSDLAPLSADEQRFLSNALARAFCDRISGRLAIAESPGPSTLEIVVTLTELKRTNAAAAGISAVLPMRAPIGLGALGVEGEALTPDGRQAAALIWRREAEPVFTSARVSSIGDAYNFATLFGEAFANNLRRALPKPVKRDAKAKDPCAQYGETRMAAGLLELFSPVQLPPAWEEKQ